MSKRKVIEALAEAQSALEKTQAKLDAAIVSDARLARLIERYNQLRRLLPAEDDLADSNVPALADAEMILAEMQKVKAEIDAMMGRTT